MTHAGKTQHRRHRSGHLISQVARRRALSFSVVTLTEEKAAGGVGDRVAPFVVAVRPRAAERGQRNNHQRWKPIVESLIVKTEFFQMAERRGFNEQIRRRHEFGKSLAVSFALEIESDAAFVGVGVYERWTALGMLERKSNRLSSS